MSERDGFLKKRKARVILWCCVLIVGGLIFFFSAQDGSASSNTSGRITRIVIRILFPDYESFPSARKYHIWMTVSHYVRKCAHFLEFAALGFFLRLLAVSYSLRPALLWAWLGGTAYAASDEVHQLFTYSRAGMWQDVLLDSSGVLFGGLAALAATAAILWLSRKRSAAR